MPGVFGIEMLFQAAELFLMLETGTGRDGAMRLGSCCVGPVREPDNSTPRRDGRGRVKRRYGIGEGILGAAQ